MAYYGNPDSLKVFVRNIQSYQSGVANADLILYNSFVEPVLESDLRAVFRSWPAPDSTDQNVISTLWIYLMASHIQRNMFSTNSTGQQSVYAESLEEVYTKTLEDLKAGRKICPGADRHSAAPSGRRGTDSNKKWKVSESNSPEQPEGVGDQFQKGLRR